MSEELKKMYEEFLEALDEKADEPGMEKLKEIVNAELALFNEYFGMRTKLQAFVIAALCEVVSDVFRAEMVKDRADMELMNELRDAFAERVQFAGRKEEA